MTITINDMMSKTLQTIQEAASVQEAAKKMKEKDVSSLVVVDNQNKPQGIITERDIVRKVCINDTSTSAVTLRDIMSSPVITIDSTESASKAVDMMLQHNVRHLLVVNKPNDSKPIGIITPLDIRSEEYTDDALRDTIEELSAYYR
ncbi:MAG TPA: CBS domain-containing protein [Nitrososphaeraceae archaeon]|nr:CBS domain-containing protein [Nitrososphaeraceae archaeon]